MTCLEWDFAQEAAARIGGDRRGRIVFDQAELDAFVQRQFDTWIR